MRSLNTHYDQLSHPERLALLIKAQARADHVEMNRLIQSLRTFRAKVQFQKWMQALEKSADLIVQRIQRSMGSLEGCLNATIVADKVDQFRSRRELLLQLEHLQVMRQVLRYAGKATGQSPEEVIRLAVATETGDDIQDFQAEIAGVDNIIPENEAIFHPLMNRSGQRIAGLLAGFSNMLQKLIGIDAPIALQALHPSTWKEIEKIGLHHCNPDMDVIEDAEQIVKDCFRANLLDIHSASCGL